jgi:hypothetical protein
VAVQAIRITSSTGATTDYQAAADTDLDRGDALLAACAAAVAGDVIEDVSAAHTFDVGTNQISPPAGTTAAPIKFQGAGKLVTIIYSQRSHVAGSAVACIRPKSNQEWRDFTLWANNPTSQQSPFGHGGEDWPDGDYTNVLLSDARIIAAVDCIHTTQVPLTYNIRAVRCEFHSNFDTIAIVGGSGPGSILELIGCTAFCQFPHPNFPYPSYAEQIGVSTRALTLTDGDCTFRVYGGTYTVAGGGSAQNSVLHRFIGGTPKLYSCALSSAGTSALDIQGDTTVGNDVAYDEGKTSGVITIEAAWAPAPPTDLVASNAGRGVVSLSWSNNAVNQTGFTIQWATNASFTLGTGSTTVAADVLAATVRGLTPGTRYYFRVFATNATGNSTNSNRATLVVATASLGQVGRRVRTRR